MYQRKTTLESRLSQLSHIEKIQSQIGKHVQDIPHTSTCVRNNCIELLNNYFFRKSRLLYIRKHNRFADYPLHTHQFTELNYMLSGSCSQFVNGKPLELHEGDLLLIGVGSSHEIKALGSDDLLVNILFKMKALPFGWLDQMKEECSPIILYLFNMITKKGNSAIYHLFHTEKFPEVQQVLKKMISEYYSAKAYSNTIATLLLPILFTLISRATAQKYNNYIGPEDAFLSNQKMIPLLHLIDENYKKISLAQTADQLGYNKTYLGNMIKKTLGVTFTQLVLKRRLYQARLLLSATDLSVNDIAEESGFSNKTYFYKMFKKTFGYLPGEERHR